MDDVVVKRERERRADPIAQDSHSTLHSGDWGSQKVSLQPEPDYNIKSKKTDQLTIYGFMIDKLGVD